VIWKYAMRIALVAVGATFGLTSRAIGAQAGAVGTGGIKGQIHDSLGIGIAGVEITLDAGTRAFETDEQGKFELQKVPAGPLSIRLRRIGFRPDTIDLMVLAGQVIPLEVRIRRLAIALAPVFIRGREALTGWRAGFYDRKDRGGGHFYTATDIDKRNPPNMTDFFRTVPGARVEPTNGGFTKIIRFRGASRNCWPLVWLDGSPLGAGEFDLDNLNPRSIEAMEVYAGPASVPAQYQSVRGTAYNCGTILIWSKEGELRPRQRKANVSAAAQIAKLVDQKKVFTANEVDVPAHQDSLRLFRPAYPDGLYDAGIGGAVFAEFVVDGVGQVNLDTFSVVYTTNPAFTESVQRALKDAVYIPAILKGYPVMQVVQHEFKFVPDSTRISRRP
jgi:TonB-dependent receptor-like protein/carboxypeptidase family protein